MTALKQSTTTVPRPPEAYRTDLNNRTFKVILKIKMEDGTFSSMRERFAVNWLLNDRASDGNILHGLKKFSLCMDLNPERPAPFSPFGGSAFSLLDKKEQDLARRLRENEDLVDVVIHSVFRWFGTNVGRESIVSLAKLLDNDELLKDFYDNWKERQVFCPSCGNGTGKFFNKVSKKKLFTCSRCNVDFYRDGTKTGTWFTGLPLGKFPDKKIA